MKSKEQKKKEKQEKKEKEREDRERMWQMFHEIWNERPHYSEVSWEPLGQELSSLFFHHILPKRNYDEAKFDKDNIILLTWDEHENVERDPVRYDEINKRREKLKEKYR